MEPSQVAERHPNYHILALWGGSIQKAKGNPAYIIIKAFYLLYLFCGLYMTRFYSLVLASHTTGGRKLRFIQSSALMLA